MCDLSSVLLLAPYGCLLLRQPQLQDRTQAVAAVLGCVYTCGSKFDARVRQLLQMPRTVVAQHTIYIATESVLDTSRVLLIVTLWRPPAASYQQLLLCLFEDCSKL